MIGQSEGGNLKYAQIIAGKFASKVDASEAMNPDGSRKPNYRVRTNKKGVEVTEHIFDYVTGTFDRIEIKDSDYGKQLTFSLRDGEDLVSIQTSAFNESGDTLTSLAATFGDQIGLIDFGGEVKVALSKKDGKVRGIAFQQGGNYIPNSKDNPVFANHIAVRPQPVERTTITGEKKWDWSAPSAWQFAQINTAIQRLVNEGVGNSVQQESLGEVPELSETDPLPF
jgi:hypothetical protein